MPNSFIREGLHWTRRAWDALRTDGILSILPKIVARLRMKLGFPDSQQRAFLARKTTADATFDSSMGTDTGGIQSLPSLTVHGQNARFGVDHIASDPDEFENALSALDIPCHPATFLDLGAGKGRALLLAARHPFSRIIGIEFAEELCAIAASNIARAGADTRISVVHGDATEVEYPDGPLVIFMFNPFDEPIVYKVATNALASFRYDPRPMRILYLNPRAAGEITRAGWRTLATGNGYMLFGPA